MEGKDQELVHIENGIKTNLGSLDAQDLQSELDSLDREMEKRMRGKFDKWILPVVTLIYLMAFIDRYVNLPEMRREGGADEIQEQYGKCENYGDGGRFGAEGV